VLTLGESEKGKGWIMSNAPTKNLKVGGGSGVWDALNTEKAEGATLIIGPREREAEK